MRDLDELFPEKEKLVRIVKDRISVLEKFGFFFDIKFDSGVDNFFDSIVKNVDDADIEEYMKTVRSSFTVMKTYEDIDGVKHQFIYVNPEHFTFTYADLEICKSI